MTEDCVGDVPGSLFVGRMNGARPLVLGVLLILKRLEDHDEERDERASAKDCNVISDGRRVYTPTTYRCTDRDAGELAPCG